MKQNFWLRKVKPRGIKSNIFIISISKALAFLDNLSFTFLYFTLFIYNNNGYFT